MQNTWTKKLTVATLCLGLIAGFAACSPRVSQANFDKIETDMTEEQVHAILGKPTDADAIGIGGFTGGASKWKASNGNVISVQFVNGKVKMKQFKQAGESS
jgi:hypothetical protein